MMALLFDFGAKDAPLYRQPAAPRGGGQAVLIPFNLSPLAGCASAAK